MENFGGKSPESSKKEKDFIIYEAVPGESLIDGVENCIRIARRESVKVGGSAMQKVKMDFNGINIVVDRWAKLSVVMNYYNFALKIGLKEIGPNYEFPTDPKIWRKYADILDQNEQNEQTKPKQKEIIVHKAESYLDKEIEECIDIAKKEEKNVKMNFNGIDIVVDGNADPAVVRNYYDFAWKVKLKEIGPNYEFPTDPRILREYADILEKTIEQEKKRKEKIMKEKEEKATKSREISEKIKDEEILFSNNVNPKIEEAKKIGNDFYIGAFRWIKYMQVKMREEGKEEPDLGIIKDTLKELDFNYSGSSFANIKKIVANIWGYGDKFREIYIDEKK